MATKFIYIFSGNYAFFIKLRRNIRQAAGPPNACLGTRFVGCIQR